MTRLPKNDPAKAGKRAAKARMFGDHGRYAVFPVHTRFDALEWFVTDAEKIDEVTGLASVIRQQPTEAQAVAGLELAEVDEDDLGMQAHLAAKWMG